MVSTEGLENIHIGDIVVGKKTGLKVPSLVVGFVLPSYRPEFNHKTTWDLLYPKWRDKYCVLTEFSTPTKPLRLDEFIEYELNNIFDIQSEFVDTLARNIDLFNQYALFEYSKIAPAVRVCYPIEDLECYEKDNVHS